MGVESGLIGNPPFKVKSPSPSPPKSSLKDEVALYRFFHMERERSSRIYFRMKRIRVLSRDERRALTTH